MNVALKFKSTDFLYSLFIACLRFASIKENRNTQSIVII